MHCGWLIGQLGSEDWYVDALKKQGIISFYYNHGTTLLDNALSKKYYEAVGWRFMCSKDKKPNLAHNMAIFGDFIAQSYYPEDIAKAINSFYSNVSDFSTMNPAELIK